MPSESSGLVRAIGRWSLTALIINSIVGSGIFGLPSVVARFTGRASVWAVLLAGVAVGVIMACFAEVASHFSEAGGPYLYARAAFGRLAGIETGWLLWLARLTAPAANADLFVLYLGEFWPQAKEPLPRLLLLTILIGILAAVNLRGVRAGTQVSNVFTVAKLLPLGVVAVGGVVYLAAGHGVTATAHGGGGASSWLSAILLLVFAYGGFETALTPMSEARNPRRDAAFGLFAALAVCTLLYTAIQWVVVALLTNPAHSDRPLSDVARLIFGPAGGVLVALGALVSVYGYLSANLLAVPRITFAFAEQKDFPALFAAVHPRFRTPYFSILVFALLTWLLALLGSFAWNVTLSAVARLFYYGATCAALPMLRRKQPGRILFRLPAGTAFAAAGVGICLILVTRVDRSGFVILLAVIAMAFVNWLAVRRKPASAA